MTMGEIKESKDLDRNVVEDNPAEERREFLKKCGRFAVYAAPAMAIVLAHSKNAPAVTAVSLA
jgi:hypothetical protein